MLTVALFSHSPHLCGAERMLLNLAILLGRPKEFHPVLLVPGEGELITEARRHGVAFEIVPNPPWYLLPPDDMGEYRRGVTRCSDALRQVFVDLNADVVLINTLTNIPAMLAAVALDIPSLVWVHGVIDSLLLPQRSSEFTAPHDGLLLQCATRVITLSNFTGEFCKQMMHCGRLDMIHNWTPVDPHFVPPPGKYRLRRFSCLNTFDSHKGHATLLKAASLLKAKRPDFELHLYGDGSARSAMENRVLSMGLGNHVRFLGRTTNVNEIYDGSLCIVNPADIEPFGMTLIEAMARYTPVIATRSGGPDDIVANGECGYLVDRGDATAMAGQMQVLLDSPGLAEQLGRKGRARVCSHFSEEAAIDVFPRAIARTVSEFKGYDSAVRTLANICFAPATERSEIELREKQSEIESLQSKNSELLSLLESAERWQQSWFRRAFRRWRPNAGETRKTGFLRRIERSVRKRRKWLAGKLQKRYAEMCDMAFSSMVAAHPTRPLKQLHRQAKLIRRSGLFDGIYYRSRCGHITGKKTDLILHYLSHGRREGCNPHPLFDVAWYLEQNPDVAMGGLDPFAHYLSHGWREERDPHPLFDGRFYDSQRLSAGIGNTTNPLAHFLSSEGAGFRPNPFFDSVWYLAQYPEVADAGINALVHYVTSGLLDGRRPCSMQVIGQSVAARHRVVLQIGHFLGGGTDRHVQTLVNHLGSRASFLILRPTPCGKVSLSFANNRYLQTGFSFDPASQFDELVEFLEMCHVGRVHIHHALKSRNYLWKLIRRLGKPFDFTVHDYYTLSPNPFLAGPDGRFVGENLAPAADKLIAAAVEREYHSSSCDALGDLSAWQAENRWLLTDADRVIMPSMDVARRFSSHFPKLKPVVSAHPETGNHPSEIFLEPIDSGTPLRIAVLGEMGAHKGADVLLACARLAQSHGNLLMFELIGNPAGYGDLLLNAGVWTSGSYQNRDIQPLIAERRPHLIWYPSLCPETYSYTLSEGLAAGRPLIVPNLGAFPERVAGRPWVWICQWDNDPADWLAFFLKIREDNILPQVQPERPAGPPPVSGIFYHDEYLCDQRE